MRRTTSGLRSIDLAQAFDAITVHIALLRDHVAIGQASGRLALVHGGLHSLPGPVADLPDKLMTEHGAERHLHVRYRGAGVDRPEVDIAIAQILENLVAVLDVARQSIDGHAEHDINAVALHMRHQVLDAGAELVACSADGGIGIALHERPALFDDERLAEFDLRFDRHLVLAVGRVAGIKQDILGHLRNPISINLFVNTGRHCRPVRLQRAQLCR